MHEQEDDPRRTQQGKGRGPALFTVLCVGIFLWLPLLGQWMGPESGISEMEKRLLAPRPNPGWDWRSWLDVPEDTDKWFDDHMGFRQELIHNHARLMVSLFGKSPSDKLLVGQQGWLYFGDRNALDHYRGIAPLSDSELSRWQRVLEKRRDALAERGVAYLLVLAPDKNLIYPEFMPESLPRATENHPLDQLARYMAANSDVEVLDLRIALEEAKPDRRVFHKTDSHWNDEGAFVAYSAILDRLGQMLPVLREQPRLEFTKTSSQEPGLGLARIVGMAYEFPEQVTRIQVSSPKARIARKYRTRYDERLERLQPIAHGVEGSDYPRAVVFRDSFSNALIPYLSEHFERILYVWDRDVDTQVVDIERPDVVIQEIVGRFLSRRPRPPEEIQQAGKKRR
ncbi:MAG: hypothetical protein VX252_15230 [Myxococcota bacterium]|nr:hypothetical protein [Myxococcota bacterium]